MQVELKHLQGLTVDASDLSKDHEIQTAPLITREAYIAAGYKKHSTQYGVMGQALSIQCVVSLFIVPHIHVRYQV
jgi:hypothetical protein